MSPERRLRILAPTRYPWRFNGPRRSRNIIENRAFVPFNWVHGALEGTTTFNPWPPRRFDLTHAFNRIPFGERPYVIGFESHLPRGFGLEASGYYRALSRMLASARCRRIIAISQHGRRLFENAHRDSPDAAALLGKTSVRYPNIEIPDEPDALAEARPDPFVVSFVGNHFARKGGCVAVRVAELALESRLPVRVEVVSALQVGRGVWTDPADERFFDRYRAKLTLPNVNWRRNCSNAEVHALLRRSHLSLLTTFSDTFGYSAIESMAHSTPVIATRQGALPEFIRHDENGLLIDLDVDANGEWIHIGERDRRSPRYEAIVSETIERLAQRTIAEIAALIDDPRRLQMLRRNARLEAEQRFGARSADAYWDDLYERALAA